MYIYKKNLSFKHIFSQVVLASGIYVCFLPEIIASCLKPFQGTYTSGQDRATEMRGTFLFKTTENLGKRNKNVFQTLETRQHRTVINEREETNKAKPLIVPAS